MLELENKIFNLLNELGVPHNLKGRKYIENALIMFDIKTCDLCTIEIYEAIAEEYNIEWQSVERCIRHAVTVVFKNTDPAVLYAFFGNTINKNSGRVSNIAFLRCLSEYLKLKEK